MAKDGLRVDGIMAKLAAESIRAGRQWGCRRVASLSEFKQSINRAQAAEIVLELIRYPLITSAAVWLSSAKDCQPPKSCASFWRSLQ
jgi:hypothetical protein